MERYEQLSVIGEGTYGVVLKCKDRLTGELVAIKRFKQPTTQDKQVLRTARREIRILSQVDHVNIVRLRNTFILGDVIHLVFEYMERNLLQELELQKNRPCKGLHPKRVKLIMWQMLKGIQYLHQRGVIHRDIKLENILLSGNCNVKVCDFGFARHKDQSKVQALTYYVATRWYRAPELLVGDKRYGFGVDIWSIGCMFCELLSGRPLFAGDNDMQQLCLIVQCRGALTEQQKSLVHLSKMALPAQSERHKLEYKYPNMAADEMQLLNLCLAMDPLHRPSAAELLRLPYFKGLESSRKMSRSESLNPLLATPGSDSKRRKIVHVLDSPDSVQSSATKITLQTPPKTAQSSDSCSNNASIKPPLSRLSGAQTQGGVSRDIMRKFLDCASVPPPPKDSELIKVTVNKEEKEKSNDFKDVYNRGYNDHLKSSSHNNCKLKLVYPSIKTPNQKLQTQKIDNQKTNDIIQPKKESSD